MLQLAETNPEEQMQKASAIALLLLFSLCLAPAAAHAQAPTIQRMGVYVVSDDLDRAATFYEDIFGRAPQVRTPGLVGFDVEGGFYAVVSRAHYASDASRGGNVVPYIKVTDIDAWLRHVEDVAPAGLLTKMVVREGPFALIRFSDPDDNIIELYELTPPAAR